MLSDHEIERLALEAARRELGGKEVESVSAAATIDSSGEEAIALTIVVTDGAMDRVSDDAVLDTLVAVRRSLATAKEFRLPIVSYATRSELDLVGDT